MQRNRRESNRHQAATNGPISYLESVQRAGNWTMSSEAAALAKKKQHRADKQESFQLCIEHLPADQQHSDETAEEAQPNAQTTQVKNWRAQTRQRTRIPNHNAHKSTSKHIIDSSKFFDNFLGFLILHQFISFYGQFTCFGLIGSSEGYNLPTCFY